MRNRPGWRLEHARPGEVCQRFGRHALEHGRVDGGVGFDDAHEAGADVLEARLLRGLAALAGARVERGDLAQPIRAEFHERFVQAARGAAAEVDEAFAFLVREASALVRLADGGRPEARDDLRDERRFVGEVVVDAAHRHRAVLRDGANAQRRESVLLCARERCVNDHT